jgi:hypothetical protein
VLCWYREEVGYDLVLTPKFPAKRPRRLYSYDMTSHV